MNTDADTVPGIASSENESKSKIQKFDHLVKKERDRRHREEAIWRRSLLYLSGDQWLSRNPVNGRIERQSAAQREKHKQAVVVNRIRPIVDARVARMTQGDPKFSASSASQDVKDIQAARLGESLLTYLYRVCGCPQKLREALIWSLVGQGYWEVYWDNNVGESYQYITDPENGEVHSIESPAGAELLSLGVEPESVNSGEIGVEVLSPFDLFVFPAKNPKDANSAIKVKGYSKEEVCDRWGDVAKDLKAGGADSIAFQNRSSDRDQKDLVVVKEVFIVGTEKNPDGMHLVYSDDKILHEGKYPYATNRLPFFKFTGLEHPAHDYDDSFIHNLSPLQKQLNVLLSQIVEHKDLTIYPQVWAARGSLDKKQLTTKPGAINEYNPNPMAKDNGLPQDRVQPPLPSGIFDLFNMVDEQMNKISGEMDLATEAPKRLDSAFALDRISEDQNSRIKPYVDSMEETLSEVGAFMLVLAQQFYSDERIMEIRGVAGITELKHFKASDLKGIKDIVVEPGSMMPKSAAAKGMMLESLYQSGAIDAQTMLEKMDSSGVDDLNAEWQSDLVQAKREIHTMIETNQPIPEPNPWDADDGHLHYMNTFAKSEEYSYLTDQQKEFFMEHYSAHSAAIEEAERTEMMKDKLRLALNIQQRSDSVDPELLTGLAGGAGIDLDPKAIAANEEAFQEIEQENRIEQLEKKHEIRTEQEDQKTESKKELKEQDAQVDKELAAVEAELERQVDASKIVSQENSDMRAMIRQMIAEAMSEKEGVKFIPVDASAAGDPALGAGVQTPQAQQADPDIEQNLTTGPSIAEMLEQADQEVMAEDPIAQVDDEVAATEAELMDSEDALAETEAMAAAVGQDPAAVEEELSATEAELIDSEQALAATEAEAAALGIPTDEELPPVDPNAGPMPPVDPLA